MESRSISTVLPNKMNGLFGIDREPRSIGSFARQFLQWRAPKTFSHCLGEFFRSDMVDCGESQQGHVVGRHCESFSTRSSTRTEQAKSSEHDMRMFGEPWTPKRLMQRGQIG